MSNTKLSLAQVEALTYVARHRHASIHTRVNTLRSLIERGLIIDRKATLLTEDGWTHLCQRAPEVAAQVVSNAYDAALREHHDRGFGRVITGWHVDTDPADPFANIPNATTVDQPERTDAASKSEVDDFTLVKAAREALTRPSNFGYYGDLPLFESWGFVFFQSAASDTIERSNFRSALAALQGRAKGWPDGDGAEDSDEYVQTVGVRHWLVGSANHLAVRVLDDQDGPVVAENLTHTFVHAVELALSLQDYSILDESDWSELESECQDEMWDAWLGQDVTHEIVAYFGVDDIDELSRVTHPVVIDGYTSINPPEYATTGEMLRDAYYRHESTEWTEDTPSSFVNANHDEVVKSIFELFVDPS